MLGSWLTRLLFLARCVFFRIFELDYLGFLDLVNVKLNLRSCYDHDNIFEFYLIFSVLDHSRSTLES